jgi:hypothetical protein
MNRTVAVGVLILTAVLGPRAAGQDDPRRRAEEEDRRALEAQRQALEDIQRAKDAATAQQVQQAIQGKEVEIKKAAEELKVLQARSAELEKRRADLEMTIKSLMAQLDQEKAKEIALRNKAEQMRAFGRSEVRVRDDQGRGMEQTLEAILKKLETIEKRLSDLEKKVQPDRKN